MDRLDDFGALVRGRRSVRAFLPTPVDRALIERAVAIAGQTPSSCNTQPWHLHVASGEALQQLRVRLTRAAREGEARAPDVEGAMHYSGAFRDRQIDAAVRLFAAQGVGRHDREARIASMLRNYAFFDAPHAGFLYLPGDGGLREATDCAMFAQTFMLALAAAGVGSCPQGALADYPHLVAETLGLDAPGKLLFGISFGYADMHDATAQVRPPRRDSSDVVAFHD